MKTGSQQIRQVDLQTFREMANAYQRSRIFLTAIELDVFNTIGTGSISSEEAALKIHADPRGTDRLLNALCTLGLIRKSNGLFSLAEDSVEFLVKGHENYLAGFMHSVNQWKSWSTLTDAVKAGTSVMDQGIEKRDGTWLESFIAAMHDRAKIQAGPIVSLINMTGVSSVLDIGGGSAAFSMAFVRVKNDVKAAVFDLPEVIPITKKYIEAEGLGDKISCIPGNYNTDPFGNGYDIAYLSAIIHINSPDGNRKLIKKSAEAVNPGGQIIIQDFILDENRITPAHGAVFALNMLVGTKEGDTYTRDEIEGWLTEAGCAQIDLIEAGFGARLMIGRKK